MIILNMKIYTLKFYRNLPNFHTRVELFCVEKMCLIGQTSSKLNLVLSYLFYPDILYH